MGYYFNSAQIIVCIQYMPKLENMNATFFTLLWLIKTRFYCTTTWVVLLNNCASLRNENIVMGIATFTVLNSEFHVKWEIIF